MPKAPRAVILVFVLLGYVLLQFFWWAYLIYDLNGEILSVTNNEDAAKLLDQKLYMILGEGTVFITLLIAGALYIRNYLLREHRLAQQERNFLLATTHELNSPIAGIRLNLQTLNRKEVTPDQSEQMIESGLKNLNRLEALVNNILTASRIDSGRFELLREKVSISNLIHGVLSRMKLHLDSKNIEVSNQVDPNLHYHLDARSLEIVVTNLLHNTIKYAPESKVFLKSKVSEKFIEVIYEDNGPGISPDLLKPIFRKFYRGENEETRTQKGTGLGLYLIKELTELHGGSVRANNIHPRGLQIILKLPEHE
ncbi:MAG: HAMP domain-containing sensor histidine kinase [Salibacteraceae bacterium]